MNTSTLGRSESIETVQGGVGADLISETDEQLQDFMEIAASIGGAQAAMLLLFKEDRLQCVASIGAPRSQVRADSSLFQRTARHPQRGLLTKRLSPVSQHTCCPLADEHERDYQSYAGIPLINSRYEVCGVLALLYKGVASEHEVDLKGLKTHARSIARYIEQVDAWRQRGEQLAHALLKLKELRLERSALRQSNRQLAAISDTDSLTSVGNRSSFDEALQVHCEEAADVNGSLALLMVDVDHFKAVNAVHGEARGDRVLTVLAEVLTRECRDTDVVCRIDADKFAVVMPDTVREVSVAIAERLRRTVKAANLIESGLTISVGICCAAAGRNNGPEDYLAKARAALAEAKKAGRNRVASSAQNPA